MADNHYNIDTELLIGEVEQRPNLWDVSNEEYKNRDLRQKSWEDIGISLVHDFNNLSQEEKKKILEKLQKRWKTSRDAFIRCRAKGKTLKSGSAAKKSSKYIYYENLKFLEKSLDLNNTQTNFENREDEEPNDAENDEVDADVEEAGRVEQVERAETTKRKKKTNKLEDSLLRFLDRNQNQQFDEDKSFLESLLPSLKKFNDNQKLEFRIGVLNLIKKITNPLPTIPQWEYTYNYQQPYTNYGNWQQASGSTTTSTSAVSPSSGSYTSIPLRSPAPNIYQNTIRSDNENECNEYRQ